MTTWLTRWIAGLLLVLPFVSAVADHPDDKEIARLVKQLGDDDFAKREAASKRLAEIGEPALDALQQAQTSDDTEVRARGQGIAQAILSGEKLRLAGHKPDPKYKAPALPCISVSADGRRLLTSNLFDTTLRLWDAETGKEVRVLEGNTDIFCGAALSPDGTRALAACRDNSVRLWDATTGKLLHKMEGHRPDGAHSVAFGPSGLGLSGGSDGQMILWDLNTGERAGGFACRPTAMYDFWLRVAYIDQTGLAATTSGINQPARLWDLETGRVADVITIDTPEGRSLISPYFSPDGTRLAGCDFNGTLRLWDAATSKELWRVERANVGPIAFSPDGKRLVTGGYLEGNKSVQIWDAQTGKELCKYEGHTDIVGCVTFFPDGKRIASTSIDGTARIWGAPR